MASKPADWFDEGNLPILAQYCDLVAEQADLVLRRNEIYSTRPVDSVERSALVRAKCEVNKTIREYALASTTLAVKLRLSVQNTIDRKSGKLDERYPSDDDDRLFAGRQLDS